MVVVVELVQVVRSMTFQRELAQQRFRNRILDVDSRFTVSQKSLTGDETLRSNRYREICGHLRVGCNHLGIDRHRCGVTGLCQQHFETRQTLQSQPSRAYMLVDDCSYALPTRNQADSFQRLQRRPDRCPTYTKPISQIVLAREPIVREFARHYRTQDRLASLICQRSTTAQRLFTSPGYFQLSWIQRTVPVHRFHPADFTEFDECSCLQTNLSEGLGRGPCSIEAHRPKMLSPIASERFPRIVLLTVNRPFLSLRVTYASPTLSVRYHTYYNSVLCVTFSDCWACRCRTSRRPARNHCSELQSQTEHILEHPDRCNQR